jgi:hypothetical protein
MGGDTMSTSSMPPPVDYTAAMGMASGNNMITALGAQGVQTFGIMESSMNRSEITAAHLELGLERIDASLEKAQLDYRLGKREEQNHHEERMAEITKPESSA